MFVMWYILILIHVGLTVAQYNYSTKLNCSSLCGLSDPPTSPYDVHETLTNISVNFNGRCVDDSQLSVGNWKNSARRFLKLINMNDTFACPKWNIVYHRPSDNELPSPWTSQLERFKTSVLKPDGIPIFCNVAIDRGVVGRNFSVYYLWARLEHGGKPKKTTGSVLSLWHPILNREWRIEPLPVRLQQNEPNGCRGNNCPEYRTMWLPASTFGTSVPYQGGTTEHYSIFARWKFQQIPGIERILATLSESVSPMENVASDLSPSNMAILGLPLLMAIPPISLLEKVSSRATVWYVFATDILAALPLLIKGIELVVLYPKTRVKMYSTLSMTGKKYGVYERWYTECSPTVGITQTAGTIIISVAVWFMMASSYCEFAFWRWNQYRNGQLNKAISENTSSEIDEEIEIVNERKSSDSGQMNNRWYARSHLHPWKANFPSLRVQWRYGLNGFAAGMLFGPVGIFFKRCFPEMSKDKQARAEFYIGIIFGVVFFSTFALVAVYVSEKVRDKNTLYLKNPLT